MKTRIIHTKIWRDDFYAELPREAKLLFFYCISNETIGLTGLFEVSDRTMMFDTGLSLEELQKAKSLLLPKVIFYRGWIYVKNAQRLGGYKGAKLENAIKKELESVPEDIKNRLLKGKPDRVSIGYDGVSANHDGVSQLSDASYTNKSNEDLQKFEENPIDTVESYRVSDNSDTSINHKPEIINNKSENINQKPQNDDTGAILVSESSPSKKKTLIEREDSQDQLIQEFLNHFNQIRGTKFIAIKPLRANFQYWSSIYDLDFMKKAVENISLHSFWNGKMTPEMLLRRKNQRNEEVDYIGELYNLRTTTAAPTPTQGKPRHNFTQELLEQEARVKQREEAYGSTVSAF